MRQLRLRREWICTGAISLLVAWGGVQVACGQEHSNQALAPGGSVATASVEDVARRPLNLKAFDRGLLDKLVFSTTNVQRQANGLKSFEFDPKCKDAAQIQAEAMVKQRKVTHVNSDMPEIRTLELRLEKVHLSPHVAEENAAAVPLINAKSGEKLFIHEEQGMKYFTRTPEGNRVENRTYVELASVVVDGWMHSKGHRANILNKEVSRMGAACSADVNADPAIVYCAQVFVGS